MAKVKQAKQKKVSQVMAIAALVVNLVLPGLGTLIAGNTKDGIWQLVLAVVSWPLMMVLIGFPLYAAAWIWALVTSINLVKSSEK